MSIVNNRVFPTPSFLLIEMPKPKKSKKHASFERDDGHSDDSSSTRLSALSLGSNVPMSRSGSQQLPESQLSAPSDDLSQHFELLAEKRTTIRTEALSRIIKILASRYMGQDVRMNANEWIKDLEPCIKRGDESESTQAVRALGLLLLAAAPESHESIVSPILKHVIKTGSDPLKAIVPLVIT